MGHTQAAGFAELEGASNRAITWHLTANHYPSIDTRMVPVCIDAIARANDGDWKGEVVLPDGITYLDKGTAPVHAIVEQHHLEAFLRA